MHDITITIQQAKDIVEKQLRSDALHSLFLSEKYFYTYRNMISKAFIGLKPLQNKIGEVNNDELYDKIDENYEDLKQEIDKQIFMIVEINSIWFSENSIPIEHTDKCLILASEFEKLRKKEDIDECKIIKHYQTYLMIDKHTKLIKIGKSTNPLNREKTLQSEKPSIKMIYIANKDIELELHRKYKEKRIRGEWFKLTDDEFSNIVTDYGFYQ